MKKIGLVFATVIMMAFFAFSVSAETEGYYTYTVKDGEATITGVDSSLSGDVIIPDTLGGYPVTAIGNDAFACLSNLESIVIPEGVTSIGVSVFRYCTNLESVIIPDGVTSIDECAFYKCTKLENIEIPDTVNYIGDSLLYDTAYYNNKDNWSDGLLINNGCLLEVLTDYAYISADIRLISCECFKHDVPIVKYFEVDSDNKYFSSDEYGVLYNKYKTELICYPFASKNKTYIIPDTVETINVLCSFYLETLVIPEGVKTFTEDGWGPVSYSLKDVYIYSDNVEINSDCNMCFGFIDQEKWFEIRDEFLKILEEYVSHVINGTLTEEIEYQFMIDLSEKEDLYLIDELAPYGTIHANLGSTAEAYALEKGISFEVLKDDITVTDEKTGVTADYTDGIFAGEPDFVITENGKNADVIFTDIYGKFASYDISFEINGEKVQPNGKVTVRIPLPEGYSMESTVVCYVDDSGNITYLDSEYVNGYIVFETDHFSEYVLIDKSSEIKDEPSTEPDEPDTPDCSCNCHKGGISGFIWKILRFFYKLFKINPTCACGVAHY